MVHTCTHHYYDDKQPNEDGDLKKHMKDDTMGVKKIYPSICATTT